MSPLITSRSAPVLPTGLRRQSAWLWDALRRSFGLVPSRLWPAIRVGRLTAAFASLLLALGSLAPAAAADNRGQPSDLEQKARLICNFLRNCKWPDRRFAQPDTPFVVGIFGSDQISEFLREDIQDRTVQGRPVQVRTLSRREELPACHLVFVSGSERDRLRPIFNRLRKANVLTVGESDNFLASGGMIQFTTIAGQVRYLLSLDATRRERIEPNGFVLRMATPRSADMRPDDRRVADGITF